MNKFDHHVKKAIVWLVREHDFFKELKADLDELKQDVESANAQKEVADVKRALRDSKYISKAEMRFRASETTVEQLVSEAVSRIKSRQKAEQVEKIREALHAEARNLLAYSHRYEGRIISLLHQLQVNVKDNQIGKANQVLAELSQAISDAGKWMKALYSQLQLTEQAARELGLEKFGKKGIFKKIKDILSQAESTTIGGVDLRIEPLSHRTLKAAISLTNKVFPFDASTLESPEACFRSSLAKWQNLNFFTATGISYLRYWVAVTDNKVMGVIGLYTYKKDQKDSAWIGWFCLDPKFRGIGIGSKLLSKFLKEAKRLGKKYIRVYSSTSPSEEFAVKLYKRLGFTAFRTEPSKWPGIEYIYWQLRI